MRFPRSIGVLLALILVASCQSDDDAVDDSGSVPAEEGGEVELDDLGGAAEEIGLEVSVAPSPHAGLVPIVSVASSDSVTARVVARSGDHVVETPSTAVAATAVSIPVVGLRSDRTYELSVEGASEDGETFTADGEYTTEPLPDWIADHDVTVDAERSSPGYTIVEWDPQLPEDEGPFTQYLAAYDDAGEVVWYYTNWGTLGGVEQSSTGTLLMHYWPYGVREVDVTGTVVNQWRPQPLSVPPGEVDNSALLAEVDPDQVERFGDEFIGNEGDADPVPVRADWVSLTSAHHENWPMPNGNILLLSTTTHELTDEQREVLCPGDPIPFDVISDVIVEHQPDGTVVRTWDLWDAIDVVEFPGSRMCVNDDLFAEPERRDWTHANSAMYDPVRDAVLVSVRHTDQIIAFDHLDEEGPQADVRWIIGPGSTMPFDGEPVYHQHAVEVLPDGAIVVFDNGNGRPGSAPDGPDAPYSRAVIFDVDDVSDDPSDWSVTQRWDYRLDSDDGTPIYASFISDADVLANGNVLVTFGGQGTFPPTPEDPLRATIVEVVPTGDSGGEIVAEYSSAPGKPTTVYRAERIESFYVGPQWASAE